jgi:hypothetical protein
MGSDIIIGLVLLFQLLVVFLKILADIFDLIKLLSVRPVGPLHIALQFRRPRGDDEESDPTYSTGFLKMLLKLRPAI